MSDNPFAICSENMEIITSEKKNNFLSSLTVCEGKMVKVPHLSRKYCNGMVVAAIIQGWNTLKKMCRSVHSVLLSQSAAALHRSRLTRST